jgi:hypothetical protein
MKPAWMVLFTAVLFLEGCATRVPSCSDDETVKVVNSILIREMSSAVQAETTGAQQAVQSAQLRVDAVRTAGVDEKIGKVSCKAQMHVSLPAEFVKNATENYARNVEWDSRNQGAEINQNNAGSDISYTVQLTDDSKQRMVEVQGLKPLIGVVADWAAQDSARQQQVADLQSGAVVRDSTGGLWTFSPSKAYGSFAILGSLNERGTIYLRSRCSADWSGEHQLDGSWKQQDGGVVADFRTTSVTFPKTAAIHESICSGPSQ